MGLLSPCKSYLDFSEIFAILLLGKVGKIVGDI